MTAAVLIVAVIVLAVILVTSQIEKWTRAPPDGVWVEALDSELEQLRRAPVGTRNHTLNRAAFCLGQLSPGGELLEGKVIESLRAVADSRGLSQRETELTIASGLAAGRLHPRRCPSS